ncbi:polysaccharide lyase [Gilvimarinus sp. 1_MG-2023]|uniref:polysaccharide lyase n=1 Tax=Gilvimarinus sp. 1_MG-2023 TaxID=3062638 RepID=UPI0026E2DB30|nr:polysaccharide lyase [Gilvimarinus sp. 1_MG-2023]MDO6747773.1 polysaccharide lyase [Gilvimarinus sp. 1_MG-2023]
MKSLLLFLSLLASNTMAGQLWRGDFETGDLSQWPYLTHPQGISIQSDCVYEGNYAADITITGAESFLWHGNPDLNRSELHFKPADTREGADVFLGWSFFLPQPLSVAKHEFGYWEAQDSWQQQMRFNIHGTALSFQASGADSAYWHLPDGASAGVWHDLAMHIHFSLAPNLGRVTIWHDGIKVFNQTMQTRANKTDAMFTQIGLLRSREDSAATLLIDNARQSDSIESLLAAFDPNTKVTCSPYKKSVPLNHD